MAGSSPARQSSNYVPSSPLSDILYGDRNSEARHKQLLEAARREHERVRRVALRALEDHQRVLEERQREEERQRILEQERREEERIRQERELAEERRRLQALQAQKVEIPPEPLPKPASPKATTSQTPAEPSTVPSTSARPNPFAAAATTSQPPQAQQAVPPAPDTRSSGLSTQATNRQPTASPFAPATAGSGLVAPARPTAAPSPFAAPAIQTPTVPPTGPRLVSAAQGQPNLQQNGSTASQAAPTAPPQATRAPPDRYEEIHQNLKSLRRSLLEQAKHNRALKERMGDMRREIRKTVGQLTHGVAAGNRQQVKASRAESVCFIAFLRQPLRA